ncbi:ABC transporter permease/M1 family aminopeptidase [Aquimarina rhabdastrellae]
MLILQLIRFELFFQFKQRLFWACSLIILFLGIVFTKGAVAGSLFINTPYQIAYKSGVFTLGSVFFIMFFAISGILRDKEYQMETLIYTTKLKKYDFFISRCIAIYIASLSCMTFFLLGLMIGFELPMHDPEMVMPMAINSYISSWLFLIIPNIFICFTIITSVAILSRNSIAIYTSAILIYALYFITSVAFNSPLMASSSQVDASALFWGAIFDPFGLNAFFEQTQYWTPHEKSNLIISMSGNLLINRVIWMVLSVLILVITYTLFRFKITKHKIKSVKEEVITNATTIYQYYSVKQLCDSRHYLRSILALIKMNCLSIYKSLSFVFMFILWIVIVITEVYLRIHQGGEYQSSMYPTTALIIELFTDPLPKFMLLLIVFYSGELIWRERNQNFYQIIDTLPISNTVFYSTKLIAIMSIPFTIITTAIILSIGFQLYNGYTHIELEQYLLVYIHQGILYLVYAFLAFFFQTIVTNKYVGMGVMAIVLTLLGSQVGSSIGLGHPLIKLANIVPPSYSAISGYELGLNTFIDHGVYWSFFGGILMLITLHIWQRGNLKGTKELWKTIGVNWSSKKRYALITVTVLYLTTGGWIYYNLHIKNVFYTQSERWDNQALYEKNYVKYKALPQLYPISIQSDIAIYPKQNKYEATINYELINKHEEIIDTVFITEKAPIENITLQNGKLVERDSNTGTFLFKMNKPILPKETVSISFKIKKTYGRYETNRTVLQNGSYIQFLEIAPQLGYSLNRELKNNKERQLRELSKREVIPVDIGHFDKEEVSYNKLSFETTFSTSEDQVGISTGKLIDQWTQDGRNYYRFKAEEAIVPTIGYFSGDYKREINNYEGITIENYYHKTHEINIKRMQEVIEKTLAYCDTNYGEYPLSHIRFVEVPKHWSFGGYAHPGVISMVEDRLYLTNVEDSLGFDVVSKRTIHEVAHQWWGRMLAPKLAPGGTLLIEGFAKYTEAVIMEKTHGKKAIWQLSRSAIDRYFRGKSYSNEEESPLYLSEGENYLAYGKAYTVMLALKELIGEEQVNGVLKKLITRYRDTTALKATSLEFINEVYKVTPQEYHQLIDDWFKRVITYDLSIKEKTIKKMKNGKYEIRLTVKAQRYSDKQGKKSPIAIDEPITLGMFKKQPKEITDQDDIIILNTKRIHQKEQEIRFIVDEKPQYISIDPYGTRLDKNQLDNTIAL